MYIFLCLMPNCKFDMHLRVFDFFDIISLALNGIDFFILFYFAFGMAIYLQHYIFFFFQ
jgi:hypothetical protein